MGRSSTAKKVAPRDAARKVAQQRAQAWAYKPSSEPLSLLRIDGDKKMKVGLIAATISIVTIAPHAIADDVVFKFQFDSKNYQNEFTSGYVRLDAAQLSAGSGMATYSDTYCKWHEPQTVPFAVAGDKIRLERFPYKYCENRSKDMNAEVSVVGFIQNGCFQRLQFDWYEENLFGDSKEGTYYAEPIASDC